MTEQAQTAAPAKKKKAPPKVTAFALDGSAVGDVDAHPFAFGGFPGLWQVGRPMLPSALGLTVTEMRDLIEKFSLPLVEVKVHAKNAHDTFPEDPNRIPSGGPETVTPAPAAARPRARAAAAVPDAAEEDSAGETGSEGETS